MLDIYAPSFVLEDEIFSALVPQHSYMNASIYLRERYLSCSGSSTFIISVIIREDGIFLFWLLDIHTCVLRSSSRTEFFLPWFLDLSMCATFILEDSILPSLVLHLYWIDFRSLILVLYPIKQWSPIRAHHTRAFQVIAGGAIQ